MQGEDDEMEKENNMLLTIGATIRCRDGEAGRLKYVVIDPDDGKITNLIVERGKLLRRDIVVPSAWVERETEGEIVLNGTIDELKQLPEYKEFEYIQPDPNYRPLSGHRVEDTRIWLTPYQQIGGGKPWILHHVRVGINDDDVIVRRGLPVRAKGGKTVGAVDHLVVEADNRRVTHLVLRRGPPWDKQMHIIPMERFTDVTESGAQLNMMAEEIDQAPLYQPPASDEQITVALQRALETDPRTHTSGLRVEVENGVVNLIGNVTNAVRDAARSIARRLRGVIGFEEDLVEPAEK